MTADLIILVARDKCKLPRENSCSSIVYGLGVAFCKFPSFVPRMQDPNADTEWNDILRSKGILPPKEEATIDEGTVVQVRPIFSILFSNHVNC